MSLQKRNNKTIEHAFKTYLNESERAMGVGMKGVMERAMYIALDQHDEEHPNHILIDGFYGWILFHDKKEYARSVYTIRGETTAANNILKGFKPSGSGWRGFLVAQMKPNGGAYFSYSYEVDVLNATAAQLGAEFYRFFSSIS